MSRRLAVAGAQAGRLRGVLGAIVACLVAGLAQPVAAQQTMDVPYVQTPDKVVQAMLEMAAVNADDYLIDLGSGDGRIPIEAARRLGTRGMGIELDGGLVNMARAAAKRLNVSDKVTFTEANIFVADFSQSTVLTMYLLPQINMQMRPRLFNELRPGTRIVSHDFDMGNWKPDARREVAVPNKSYGPPVSQVYLWHVPAQLAGTWRWELKIDGKPRIYEAKVAQTFQELDLNVLIDGSSVSAQTAQLRGFMVTFSIEREIGGRKVSHVLRGRVDGDTIDGAARIAGADDGVQDWKARRIARGTVRTDL